MIKGHIENMVITTAQLWSWKCIGRTTPHKTPSRRPSAGHRPINGG